MLRNVYWILAAILLTITLAVPRLRPASIVGLIILAALLAWGVIERMSGPNAQSPGAPQRGQPTSPAVPLSVVPVDLVEMKDMRLLGSGAPFELRGRIANRSNEMQIKSVTILVIRRDCYEGALDPSGCSVLWQDRHWMPLTTPPHEEREFSSSIWMRGSAPRPRGEIRDSFELVGATGEVVGVERR
jgi:hypothetical protein